MIKHCVLQLNIFSLDALQKKTEYKLTQCRVRNELTPAVLFSLSESLRNVNNNTLVDYTIDVNYYWQWYNL